MNIDPAYLSLTVAIVGGMGITFITRKFSLPTIVIIFAGGILLGPKALEPLVPASIESILSAIVSQKSLSVRCCLQESLLLRRFNDVRSMAEEFCAPHLLIH